MTRADLRGELLALADSLDDHVTERDIVNALDRLTDRVESEGLTDD